MVKVGKYVRDELHSITIEDLDRTTYQNRLKWCVGVGVGLSLSLRLSL